VREAAAARTLSSELAELVAEVTAEKKLVRRRWLAPWLQ
jgi:hypothetical protein